MIRSIFILLLYFSSLSAFDKVVIWGHKLHSHTHSYIHDSFYNAFKHLGYNVEWYDKNDQIDGIDFANTLFLTEGQVDEGIPLQKDGVYILHNCNPKKYQGLDYFYLQVYNDTVLNEPSALQIDKCIYFDFPGRCVYIPWATDLLPNEIDVIKRKVGKVKKSPKIYWVGTVGDGYYGNKSEIDPFINACKESNIVFVPSNPNGTGISAKKHQDLILKSYMAPAIVGEWQKSVGYIPCRIFKNISYGQWGITNSKRVYELFDNKIVYNSDTYQLFKDAQQKLKTLRNEELFGLMDIVKTKHTYLNRIETLLRFHRLLKLYDASYE